MRVGVFQYLAIVLILTSAKLSPGILPVYLLPAYEEAVNRPATPPPPYTPLQLVLPSSDRPQEDFSPHSAVSVPCDANIALDGPPEAMQIYSSCTNNPNKDSIPGRYRRFTGDSGIEVCDGQEHPWDQHDFFEGEEMLEEGGVREMEDRGDSSDFAEQSHAGTPTNYPG